MRRGVVGQRHRVGGVSKTKVGGGGGRRAGACDSEGGGVGGRDRAASGISFREERVTMVTPRNPRPDLACASHGGKRDTGEAGG